MNFEVSEKGTPTGIRGMVECRDERTNTPRECTEVFETTRKPHLCFGIPAHLLSHRDDLRRLRRTNLRSSVGKLEESRYNRI